MIDPFAAMRATMVRELGERGALHDAGIAEAFRTVPRHLFLPGVSPNDVYTDRAVAVKLRGGVPISSSSQPAMMAEMLEQLALRPGERILEIGAGTGYNAALIAHLTGPAGRVTTIDLDDDLVAAARRHLDDAGFPDVRTVCADGTRGDPQAAPFDAIIATVGVGDVPAAWFEQLRIGGRLVMPLALRSMQKVVRFERTASSLASSSIVDGSFMMLRGSTASVVSPATQVDDGTFVRVGDPATIDAPSFAMALRDAARLVEPARRLTIEDVWTSFGLWLALHDDAFGMLSAMGPAEVTSRIPDIMGAPPTPHYAQSATLGLACDGAAVVFAPRPDGTIVLHAIGAAQTLVDRMQRALLDWDAGGRLRNDALSIVVVPHNVSGAPSRGDEDELHPGGEAATVQFPSARATVRWRRR